MSISPSEIAYQEAHANENLAPVLIGVTAMFLVLTIASLAGRIVARYVSRQPFKADDYSIIFATVTFVSLAIEVFLSAAWGAGRHVITLTDIDTLTKFGQVTFAIEISYSFCVASFKLSVLLFYRRVFEMRVRYFRYAFWCLIVYLIGWFIAVLVVILTACSPISSYWTVGPDVCRVAYAPGEAFNILNAVSDTLILTLPIPIIWRLNLPVRQRRATIGVFLLGSFVVLVSCLRIPSLKAASTSTDPSFDEISGVIWTIAECSVGIICANLPMMRPLFKSVFPDKQSTVRSTATPRYGLSKTDRTWEAIGSDHIPPRSYTASSISEQNERLAGIQLAPVKSRP